MVKGKYEKPFIEKVAFGSDCILASGLSSQREAVGSFMFEWLDDEGGNVNG